MRYTYDDCENAIFGEKGNVFMVEAGSRNLDEDQNFYFDEHCVYQN